jgi:CDP-diacylglycerol---serine O-phosphatidyltransferase
MRRPSKHKKRRLLVLPLSRLFPNMITLGGLCCGLSAIRLALEGKYEMAVILLVAAAVIDGMDGRIARFLNSTSAFGAQLDSLSDFLCFGVSPMLLLYLWKLQELKGIGWALVLFFAVCCALRLARFNTNLAEETQEPWQMKFFVGVPSPAGAMLVLMPLISSFYAPGIADNAIITGIWSVLVASLMASRIPTFAAKKVHVHHEWLLSLMVASCVVMVLVFIEPWTMFTLCGVIYCACIPISARRYRKLAAAASSGDLFEPDLHHQDNQ